MYAGFGQNCAPIIASPSTLASTTSELNPAVQLQFLKSLIQVKVGQHDTAATDGVHVQMNNLTENLFWITSDHDPRSCLLEALGTFLTQIIGVFAQISVSLTEGPHVEAYAEDFIRSVAEENDYADLSIVPFIDEKLSTLRSV